MSNNHNAKFAFFYLLSLVALVFMAISTGMIIFQIINKSILDVIDVSNFYNSSALKFAISAMIISAPIYYITMRQINHNLRLGHLDKDSAVRRWLTYFILLVTAIVVIVWLIMTVNNFLEGELTLKFILKDLTVLAISAIIFTYYLYDIKRQEVNVYNKIIRIYFYGSLVILLASFISAFFFVESPREARDRKQDELVLNDLSQIDSAVSIYYQDKGEVPADLSVLVNDRRYFLEDSSLKNEATGEVYAYQVKAQDAYEICADFLTSNQNQNKEIDTRYYSDKQWEHAAGHQCFEQIMINYKGVPPAPQVLR